MRWIWKRRGSKRVGEWRIQDRWVWVMVKVVFYFLTITTMKPWQIGIYKWEYRMVYGIYEDGYVSLCFHDYLDTECDTMIQSHALEIVDNNDFYVIEAGRRIIYVTAWDTDTALEMVDWMLLDGEKIYSCTHWSVFISYK